MENNLLSVEDQILLQQQLQQEYELQSRQTERERPPIHEGQRCADETLGTWKMPEKVTLYRYSVSSRLNLSSRGSTTDLKEFLRSRGELGNDCTEKINSTFHVYYIEGKTNISGLHLAAAKGDVNRITSIIRVLVILSK